MSESTSGTDEAVKSRINLWSVIKATWPLIAIGLAIIILTALLKPFLDDKLCTKVTDLNAFFSGKDELKCPPLYEYAFDKGILLDVGVGLAGLPFLWAAYVDRLWKSLNELFIRLIEEAARTPSVIQGQIKTGAVASGKVRELLTDCIRYYDGQDSNPRQEFANYIGDVLAELNASNDARYRRDYNANITIMPINGTLAARYYRWTETISYVIEGRKGQQHPLKTLSRIMCDADELEHAIKQWSFKVKVKKWIFDFAAKRHKIDFDALKRGTPVELENVKLEWADGLLTIRVELNFTLESDRANVHTEEDSFIGRHERDYALAMRYPTQGFQLELRVPADYRIVTKSFSPVSVDANASCDLDVDGTKVTLHHSGWFMPGLATVLVWTKVS